MRCYRFAADRLFGEPDRGDEQHEKPSRDPEHVVDRKQRCLLRDHAVDLGQGLVAVQSRMAELGHRLARLGCVGGDAFDEMRVVHGFTALPERRCQRCAEASRGDTKEVDEPRAERHLAGAQIAQRDGDKRREIHGDARALQQCERPVVRIGSHIRAPEAGRGEDQERRAGEHRYCSGGSGRDRGADRANGASVL